MRRRGGRREKNASRKRRTRAGVELGTQPGGRRIRSRKKRKERDVS